MHAIPLIFVVEDDEDIASLISFHLINQGYQVETFGSGDLALQAIHSRNPTLVLLDLMLPKIEGLKVCEILKGNSNTKAISIVMVTAKGEEADIVRGLELGAEDYITKPFSPQVLVARVKNVLRRSQIAIPNQEKTLSLQNIVINPARREVSVGGEKVELTNSEFQLLYFLAQKPGWVFTRGQIVDAIRGTNYAVTERSIDVVIVGLRKKLGESGNLVDTVRGVGYRIKEFS
ncbi:MAG: response regulator transcription factor [Pseudomonadota bacterium]|nr:response regulator transcription factor [Pseudomonadota bacterium]